MKKLLSIGTLLFSWVMLQAQNRFPKPDFESGYQYPELHYAIPNETLWVVLDLFMLVLLMSIVVWAVYKKHTRKPIFWVSVISVAYFGFFRSGCVCSIGSIQNIALAMVDSTYHLPLTVLLFFILPILFAFFVRAGILCGCMSVWGPTRIGERQELPNLEGSYGYVGNNPLVISYIRRFIRCDEKPFYHLSVRPVYWYLPFRRRCGTSFVRGLVADFICFHREAVLSFLMSLRSVIKSFLFGVYLENSSFPKSMYQLRTLP